MSTGPFSYNYYTKIKSPSQAGATADGDLPSLGKDKDVLLNYADILWEGKSNNSNLNTNNRSLGDAYFYETPQDCKIQGTNDVTKRYIYVNNVPKGYIGGAKGLLPGIIEDLGDLIPNFADFVPAQPECINVSLEVIDSDSNASIETHYMALTDVRAMDPCDFPDKINPTIKDENKKRCQQGFQNKKKSKTDLTKYLYLSIFIIIVLFLMFRYN